MMSKILVVGDSYSASCGFIDPAGKVWHNYLSKDGHTVTNISVDGSSNEKIFFRAATELTKNRYDLVVVQWSSLFRLNLHRDETIYNNYLNLSVASAKLGLLAGPTLDKEFREFAEFWVKHFLHGRLELLNFLDYTIILGDLLTLKEMPFVYIKTFDNFMSEVQQTTWKDCSENFKEIVLHHHNHPDDELEAVFSEMRNRYLEASKIKNWMNLESPSWIEQTFDYADDKRHPGVATSLQYYNDFRKFVNSIGIANFL
jgi:hypothetical protein